MIILLDFGRIIGFLGWLGFGLLFDSGLDPSMVIRLFGGYENVDYFYICSCPYLNMKIIISYSYSIYDHL